MIPVALASEPADFDANIRQRGLSAIDELVGRPPRVRRSGPRREAIATREEDIPPGRFPDYWTKALPWMLDAYESRCAYLATRIFPGVGVPTVDHMIPKSHAWDKVYEWSNYRLCAALINALKGDMQTLVDPCEVGVGWFAIHLGTLHVERGDAAPEASWPRIDATLPVLNHRMCVRLREQYVTLYRLGPDDGGISFSHLEYQAPFLAAELRRQGQLVRGDL